jgi:hypothetical protein
MAHRSRQDAAVAQSVGRDARAKLAALHGKLREVIAAKKRRMRELTKIIRAERLALRERLRAAHKRALEKLREAARAELAAARREWVQRRREAKEEATSEIARVRAELAAERAQRVAQRKISRAHRADVATHTRAAREQSDDEVRALIPRELVPLFERVKRTVRGGAQTRAEAFLRYAELHPDETLKAVDPRREDRLEIVRGEIAHATRAAAHGDTFRLSPTEPAVGAKGRRPKGGRQQSLDLDSTLPWGGGERSSLNREGASVVPHVAHEKGAEIASKGAIGEAHEKIRKLQRALENQERRYERGDFGRRTRAEVWAQLVETGERLKAASQEAAAAESAFRAKHGREAWEATT